MNDAIRFVLRGSQWLGKDELARLMRKHGDTYNTFEKAFLSRFGDVDFDWPWFDECLQRFSALGRHPDRWDEFFDNGVDEDEPFTVRGALARLRKADLLALARESGVPVRSADKVDAIRAVLAERLPEHVAASLVQQAESDWAASLAKAQRHRKRILLYQAILGVDWHVERQRQLLEAGFTYYVPESVVIKAETSPVICLASNIRLTVRVFSLPIVFAGPTHCLLASKVGAGGTA
jgi:hypothetical protein